MATTQLSKVTVEELTKFGFKSNGEYINWSKTLKDDVKILVVAGRTFQMELYIADSGKKYVNKVLQMVESADVPKADTARVKKYTPKETTINKEIFNAEKSKGEPDVPMTRKDWDSKDTRISRQGVIQAAIIAVSQSGLLVDLESLFTEAEVLAEKMLAFVNNK